MDAAQTSIAHTTNPIADPLINVPRAADPRSQKPRSINTTGHFRTRLTLIAAACFTLPAQAQTYTVDLYPHAVTAHPGWERPTAIILNAPISSTETCVVGENAANDSAFPNAEEWLTVLEFREIGSGPFTPAPGYKIQDIVLNVHGRYPLAFNGLAGIRSHVGIGGNFPESQPVSWEGNNELCRWRYSSNQGSQLGYQGQGWIDTINSNLINNMRAIRAQTRPRDIGESQRLVVNTIRLRVTLVFDPNIDADNDGVPFHSDCDDLNPTIWRNNAYRDADMDGFNDGTGQASPCFGNTVPTGWTLNATLDNCPGVSNPSQSNLDGDAFGDACDIDRDGDGFQGSYSYGGNGSDCNDTNASVWRTTGIYPDFDEDGFNDGTGQTPPCWGNTPPRFWTTNSTLDNCVGTYNPGQENHDGDSLGDACDPDIDNDGVENDNDCDDYDITVWRNDAFPDADLDGLNDGTGDPSPCFGDTVPNGWTLNPTLDNCPGFYNPNQENLDGDAFGDICDSDRDGDLVNNELDCAPDDATIWRNDAYPDFDEDGFNDGTPEPSPCFGDTVPQGWTLNATLDNCPGIYNPGQENLDGDAFGDPCDDDRDGDGIENTLDCAPDDNTIWRNDAFPDFDLDGFNDGTGETSPCFGDTVPEGWTLNATLDNCPFDFNPDQIDQDMDGFGNPCDLDDNGNGIPDGPDCASPDTTVWSGQGTIDFFDPKNWNNGTPSMSGAEIAMFDTTAQGLPGFPTPVFAAFSDNLAVGAFTHANQDFRINLNSNDLIISGTIDRNGPRELELGVDQCLGTVLPAPSNRPVLRLTNNNVFPSIVRSPSAIIGSEGAADLAIDSSTGTVRLEFLESLTVGKNGDGTLELNDSRAELRYGDPALAGGTVRIGVNAAGTVDVFAGSVEARNTIDSLTLGLNPFGVGSILLNGTSWTHSSNELVVGDAGTGSITISGGATFATDISTRAVLARLPGSTAQVTISGVGSEWLNIGAPLETGLGDVDLTVEDGAELTVFGYINSSGSSVGGNGTIQGDVVNFGDVVVGRRGDTIPKTLTINGNFDQFDNPTDPTQSGRILFDLHPDPKTGITSDTLVINGRALMGGSLIVNANGAIDAPIGTEITLVSANTLEANQFDVALLPGLPSGKFLRPRYNAPGRSKSPELGQGSAVTLVVDSITDTSVGAPNDFSPSGIPTNAALGDIDGDGFDDLVIVLPVDQQSGQLVILLNGQTTEPPESWPGFTGGTVILPTGPDPSDVAVGELDNQLGVDIAITSRTTGAVETYLSNGSSSIITRFDPGPTAFFNNAPTALILADLNMDGFNDIAVAGEAATPLASGGFPGLITVRINFGETDGSWDGLGIKLDHFVGDGPVGLGADDLDNEKDIDIFSVNNESDDISVLENLGGSGESWLGFAPAFSLDVGRAPIAALSADLDVDGDIDFITANREGDSITTILRDPSMSSVLSDTYEPAADIPVGEMPTALTLWDIDTDLDPDPVVIVTNDMNVRVARVLRNLATENADAGTPGLSFTIDRDLAEGESPIILLTGQVNSNEESDLAIVTSPDEGEGLERSAGLASGRLYTLDTSCRVDLNMDGDLDFFDISGFLTLFNVQNPIADFNGDTEFDFFDISLYLSEFFAGCP